MTRLETVEPDFKSKVLALLKEVEEKTGLRWGVSAGRRTMDEQRKLYAQGRTTPGKVVTNAKEGQSAHNFGLAVDLWPYTKDGKDFAWNTKDAVFKVLADAAGLRGLVAGFYFKSIHDAPHIEDPRWKTQQARWKAGEIQIA